MTSLGQRHSLQAACLRASFVMKAWQKGLVWISPQFFLSLCFVKSSWPFVKLTFGSSKLIGDILIFSQSHETPACFCIPIALDDATVILFCFLVSLTLCECKKICTQTYLMHHMHVPSGQAPHICEPDAWLWSVSGLQNLVRVTRVKLYLQHTTFPLSHVYCYRACSCIHGFSYAIAEFSWRKEGGV